MWQKPVNKTVFTLAVDGFSKGITALTFPLLRYYAQKIGATFRVIETRAFPSYPPVFEKLQIFKLGQEMGNDWNIFFDADALVHPETIDFTAHIPKDTVAHNGADMANIRWQYDRYFWRDGRHIGSCNWCTMASDWCIELWEPPPDQTLEEALRRIYPTVHERNTVITPDHLIDDYTLSRNIAKYGLKCTTLEAVLKTLKMEQAEFFWHEYTVTPEEKIRRMCVVLARWNIDKLGIYTDPLIIAALADGRRRWQEIKKEKGIKDDED